MSNRILSIAVAVLLVLGVLTSAVVVMQNQQLLYLADSVKRISDQAERTFDVVSKRAMEENGTERGGVGSVPVVMHALYLEAGLGIGIAVPPGPPGLYEVEEEQTSVGTDAGRLPTAVVRIRRGATSAEEPSCSASVFIGDADYRGIGSGEDPDKPLIEDPDRFHVYGPEELCGASIIVLPRT